MNSAKKIEWICTVTLTCMALAISVSGRADETPQHSGTQTRLDEQMSRLTTTDYAELLTSITKPAGTPVQGVTESGERSLQFNESSLRAFTENK